MIAAYRRRRGWLAWQTAVLQRFDFPDGYPTLPELMDTVRERSGQSETAMLHSVKLWKASLGTRH